MPDNKSSIEQQVERYLGGQMSESEQRAFEARCESDADFGNEAKVLIASEYVIRNAVLQEEAEAREEADVNVGKTRPLWQRPYMLAAAAVLLLITGLFLWPAPGTPYSFDRDVDKHFPPIGLRGSADSGLLDSAHQFFNDKTYDQALGLYEKYALSHPEEVNVQYNIARCYFKAAQWGLATQSFQDLENDPNFGRISQLFLAYTYYAQGRKDDAIPYLQALSKGASGKEITQDAKALLEEIESSDN